LEGRWAGPGGKIFRPTALTHAAGGRPTAGFLGVRVTENGLFSEKRRSRFFPKKLSRFCPKKRSRFPAQRSNPSSYHPDSFCIMRCVRMRCAGHEDSPGQSPISSLKRRFHVRPVGHPPSAGVGPVQKWSVPPGRPCWSPKKGNNFGQQKSTVKKLKKWVLVNTFPDRL
jgi:hypothetical protein